MKKAEENGPLEYDEKRFKQRKRLIVEENGLADEGESD